MDVQTLLTLPISSAALSAFSRGHAHERSGSPPRKLPRLDPSPDLGFPPRFKGGLARERQEGPIAIQVLGEPVEPLPEYLHNQNLGLLRRSIKILLTRNLLEHLPASYDEIYSACRFVVCASNKGEGLFENVKIELEICVGRLAKELTLEGIEIGQWTTLFVQICDWFECQMSLLKSLLTYLDQSFIRKTTKLPCVHDLGFALFAQRIFQNPQIADRLRSSISEWVSWERENREEHQSRILMSALVCHLTTHGQYYSLFEPFYIDTTRSFYGLESIAHIEMLKVDAGEFIAHVNQRVEEETQRAKAVFLSHNWNIIQEVTEKALLDGRLEDLATNALCLFMDPKRMSELTHLYRMFARVDGLKVLCAAFKDYVTKEVQTIVQAVMLDDEMVQRLLDFKALADSTLSIAFTTPPSTPSGENSLPTAGAAHNNRFSYALIDAFQTGFKTRRDKPAEMIAKYIDKAMREPDCDISDTKFEKRLDAALALYRFTDDKDVFRTFYHRALAKRLLLGRSASDDAEKYMLKKLKEQYDPEFGMGDHMFNDLALSRDMMREYHGRYNEGPTQNISVVVLQQSVWPFAARKTTVDLPPSMHDELTKFAAFYKTKHQGRSLNWDYALGTVTLKARFDAGPKELSVSLYQAVVLLSFNDTAELSYTDILEQTNMSDAELRRTLQSLACGKKRVLTKIPVGRDVNDGDVFRFNAGFTNPHPRIHINSIQVKETPEESRRTQITIEGDRKYYLDAAIVRIMKSRKELSFEQLKMETAHAVKSHFIPEVGIIKQRIQVLVEQDYLKRNKEDMSVYTYVA